MLGMYASTSLRNATHSMIKRSLSLQNMKQYSEKMEYSMGFLEVGHWSKLQKKFTSVDVQLFSDLSMDYNSLHLEESIAKKSIFKKRIVHGILCSGLISAVAGTKVPGPGSIYLSQTLKFTNPVFYDDTLTAFCLVTSINYQKKRVALDTTVYNQDGLIVISGDAIVLAPTEKIEMQNQVKSN